MKGRNRFLLLFSAFFVMGVNLVLAKELSGPDVAASAHKQTEQSEESLSQATAATLIWAGMVLANGGATVDQNSSIIIVDQKIHRIIPGFVDVASLTEFDHVTVVNLKDKFVLPSLIDTHVHLLMLHKEDQPDHRKNRIFPSNSELTLNGVFNAKLTLDAGFTTVRDLGAPTDGIFSLRDAIDEGRIVGPRILASGNAIAVTGGHGDDSGFNTSRWEAPNNDAICDGVAECRKAVRSQIKRTANVIKITITGGGGKPQGGPDAEPEFFADEFVAAVETAHRLEKKVAVHAHGTKGIKLALQSGADSIEHSTFLDKETIALFDRSSQFMVPTLSVRDNLIADIDEMPEYIRARARYIVEITPKLMGDAHKKGVRFANGSDAGVVPHGNNARELEWLVKIGLTPKEAITTATLNAAELLGLENQIGSISVGMQADIIAVTGNPVENISDLRNIEMVMKSGQIYRGHKGPVHTGVSQ